MSAAIASHVAAQVRAAMGELVTEGTRLEALGAALVESAALSGGASAAGIVHAAATVRALAVAALDGAQTALLAAERLDTLAAVLAADVDAE